MYALAAIQPQPTTQLSSAQWGVLAFIALVAVIMMKDKGRWRTIGIIILVAIALIAIAATIGVVNVVNLFAELFILLGTLLGYLAEGSTLIGEQLKNTT